MARVLIRAALEANEGDWEAIHGSREGYRKRSLVLGGGVGIARIHGR